MRLLLRHGLGLLLLTVLVWAVAIVYWQETHRAVSAQDVVVYLVALPIGLFFVFLLMRFGIDAMKAPAAPAPTAAGAAGAAAAAGTGAADATAAAERGWVATVLAAQAISAAGDNAEAITAALAEGGKRVALDKELKDDAGLPLFAARVPQLDVAAIEQTIDALRPALTARREAWAQAEPSQAVLRSLALLDAVLQPLAGELEAITAWLLEPAPAANPTRHARRLQVLLAVPPGWSEFDAALAQAWLGARIAAQWAGPLGWPAGDADKAAWQLVPQPVASGEALLLRIDKLLTLLRQQEHEDLVLALAAESWLDDALIEQLAARGELFRPGVAPQGVMPGEAAAALLLAPGHVMAASPLLAPPDAPRITRLALLERDKPAGAAGRISGQCLGDAITHALAAAGCEGSGVARVVSDLDHRGSRSGELYQALPALLPELDAATEVWALGLASGASGVADALCTLAVASVAARGETRPVLAATVSHPRLRAAALVLPSAWRAPPPSSAPPAAAVPA